MTILSFTARCWFTLSKPMLAWWPTSLILHQGNPWYPYLEAKLGKNIQTESPLSVSQAGNKQKWVPLMIEVKSEGPRERSASRNNSRQNEHPRLPPNARNDLRGQSVMSFPFKLLLPWSVKFKQQKSADVLSYCSFCGLQTNPGFTLCPLGLYNFRKSCRVWQQLQWRYYLW